MKVLLWDIETLPMEAYTWSLYPEKLSHDNIIQGTTIACASWKWLGKREVFHAEIDPKEPRNDYRVVSRLAEVLTSADVIVAHNGDKFDLRKFRARALFWGFDPIPPVHTIDTKKVAKKYFGFDSNRLDYLAQELLGEGKIHVDFELWKEILRGSVGALKQMVEYNIQDVRLLERIYLVMRPYIENHPNAAAFDNPGQIACTACGSTEFQSRGKRVLASWVRQRYQCNSCGHWFSGQVVEKGVVKG